MFVFLNLHLTLFLPIADEACSALITDFSCWNPSSEKVACVVHREGVVLCYMKLAALCVQSAGAGTGDRLWENSDSGTASKGSPLVDHAEGWQWKHHGQHFCLLCSQDSEDWCCSSCWPLSWAPWPPSSTAPAHLHHRPLTKDGERASLRDRAP